MTIEGAKNNGVDQLKWHGVNIDDLSKTDDSNSAAPKENSIFALVDGDGNGNIDEGEYKYLQSLIEDNMENKNGKDVLTTSGAKQVLKELQRNGNKAKSLIKNITANDLIAFAQKILSIQNDKVEEKEESSQKVNVKTKLLGLETGISDFYYVIEKEDDKSTSYAVNRDSLKFDRKKSFLNGKSSLISDEKKCADLAVYQDLVKKENRGKKLNNSEIKVKEHLERELLRWLNKREKRA